MVDLNELDGERRKKTLRFEAVLSPHVLPHVLNHAHVHVHGI